MLFVAGSSCNFYHFVITFYKSNTYYIYLNSFGSSVGTTMTVVAKQKEDFWNRLYITFMDDSVYLIGSLES